MILKFREDSCELFVMLDKVFPLLDCHVFFVIKFRLLILVYIHNIENWFWIDFSRFDQIISIENPDKCFDLFLSRFVKQRKSCKLDPHFIEIIYETLCSHIFNCSCGLFIKYLLSNLFHKSGKVRLKFIKFY